MLHFDCRQRLYQEPGFRRGPPESKFEVFPSFQCIPSVFGCKNGHKAPLLEQYMVNFISKVTITRCCPMCCRVMPVIFCGKDHSSETEALSMIERWEEFQAAPMKEEKGGNGRVILLL